MSASFAARVIFVSSVPVTALTYFYTHSPGKVAPTVCKIIFAPIGSINATGFGNYGTVTVTVSLYSP